MSRMPKDDFISFVLHHLSPLGRVRARAMFGGCGVYLGDMIFAIVVEEGLYFKVDERSFPAFEAKGLSPFTYEARGKRVSMRYFEAPAEVFEQREAMVEWGRRAIDSALRAGKGKRRRG